MATLILGAIGSNAFGYAGALVGSLIGGLIDQKLFGVEPTQPEGPDSLTTGRDEGVPVSWGSGQEVVVEGTLRWASPLRKVEDSEKGKGGGKKETTTITYKADVALAFMKQPTDSIRRLWIGGDLIYNADADVSLSGDTVEVASVTAIYRPSNSELSEPEIDSYEIRYESSAGGVDLSLLVAGYDVTVDGFTDSDNNGTRRVISSWKNVDGSTVCIVEDPTDTTGASTEGDGDDVTFEQDLPEFSPSRLGSLTYFNGAADQSVSSTIEAFEGSGNVPAWRGWSYAVLTNLDVTKWAGTFPTIRALIRQDADGDLASIVSDICLRSGKLSADEIDVTALAGIEAAGIAASGPQASTTLLKQLAITHNLEAQERDGKIRFFTADEADVVAVSEEKWGVVEPGGARASRLARRRIPRQRLASGLHLTFFDPDRDYNQGSARFSMIDNPVERESKIPLDMVLTREDALIACKRLVLRAMLAAEEFELTLPPELIEVLAGDILTVTESSIDYSIRVEQITRGDNALVVVRGVREALDSFTQEVDVEEVSTALAESTELVLPKEVQWTLADIPPLADSDATSVGVYVFMGASSPGDAFTGGVVFQSLDGGISFTGFQTIAAGSLYARVIGTLGDGDAHFIDNANTLTVELLSSSATLSAASAAQVLNGANQMLVGQEVVGFTQATLVSGTRYELTGLLRGLRGTHNQTTTHESGEFAVRLSFPAFKEIGVSGSKQLGTYVGIPAGGSTDDYSTRERTLVGRTAEPLDVYAIAGSRDGSDNLTLTWSRRTRIGYAVLTSALTPPQVEASIAYEVDILDGSTVVRTITASSETASYTAAQQTTDGLTPGDPVDVRIYQIGSLVGRGRVSEATV